MNPVDIKRFMDKIKKTDNCWIWTATKTPKGYGQFSLNGKMVRVHRVSYQLFKGDIPNGLMLDHLCRNPSCVNPDHLEAVTNKVNQLRGNTIIAKQVSTTHCPKGHEYTKENTYLTNQTHR